MGKALGRPLRRAVMGHLAHHEGVVADHRVGLEGDIALRRARLLALKRMTDEKAIQGPFAAIEGVEGMIAAELLDAKPG